MADCIADGPVLADSDVVIMKVSNRSRRAGVRAVPADELDEMRQENLTPLENLDMVVRVASSTGPRGKLGCRIWQLPRKQLRHF